MKPSKNQRDLSYSFDFSDCLPSQTPSIEAKGITSQITGSRANIIIADDLEVSINSLSAEAREKLESLSKEFVSVLMPEGSTIYLGTPHSSSSIYNRLPGIGYTLVKFPAYDEAGKATEPLRFPAKALEMRKKLMGESEFQLQYMLDTSLADKDKFPLKLSDLIVTEEFDAKTCREQWKKTGERIPFVVGEAKGYDTPYKAQSNGFEVEYTKRILVLDPAGSGKDSFAWSVLATRNGYYYVLKQGRWSTGLTQQVLKDIKALCFTYQVHELVCEINFGGDTLVSLLKANVKCEIIEIRSTTNKEKRIISTLEPVLNMHKLVVNKEFLLDDIMTSQFCNLSPAKGSLKHDDSIDCLALGIAHLRQEGAVNLEAMRRKEAESRLDRELSDLIGGGNRKRWV